MRLDWPGVVNARDLGGLPAAGGRTRPGAIVRSDSLQKLTAEGWRALLDHGVRTIVDLRDDDEIGPDAAPRPAELVTVQVPLDGVEDREFWDVWATGPQFGTPLYYRPFLDRFPERVAAVVRAVADAPPGGVAYHCGGGRDRVGLVTALLLALAGVAPEEIAADYALSAERLPALYRAREEEDQGPVVEAFLREHGTTAPRLIVELLADTDLEAILGEGGLTGAELEALRVRLLD